MLQDASPFLCILVQQLATLQNIAEHGMLVTAPGCLTLLMHSCTATSNTALQNTTGKAYASMLSIRRSTRLADHLLEQQGVAPVFTLTATL